MRLTDDLSLDIQTFKRGVEMKRKVVVLLLMVFSAAFWALAGPGVSTAAEFSADFVVQTEGEDPMTGKIFVKAGKIRQEMAEEGEDQVMIFRPDKNVSWMLSPSEKTYMEMPYQMENRTLEEWTAEQQSKSKLLGEEEVSGFACKIYESMEDGEKITFWISSKLSFPLKVKDMDSVVEYKDIKQGPVADALFEVPEGYKKIALPMMPKNMDQPK